MPRIPPATSQQSLTGARTAPVFADPSSAGAPDQALAEGFAKVSTAFGQIEDRQREIRQAGQATALDLHGATQLADLQLRFAQDTAPDAGPRFQAETARIREQVIGQTDDPAVQRLVGRDFDRRAISGYVAVRQDEVKRTVNGARASLDDNLDQYARLSVGAANEGERTVTMGAARAAIAGAVATGVIQPTDAGKVERAFMGRIDQARVARLINDDPSAAANALADPKQYPNLDPLVRERLYATASGKADRDYATADTIVRREQTERAAAASKDFNDAFRAGDQARINDALARLRRDGTPGDYASAADQAFGTREPPTTPQMTAWIEERMRDRGAPLTRDELDKARADRRINDSTFRDGLSRLAGREDARFREAEQFVDRALQTPSATILDRDLLPYQREGRRQQAAIVNDLVLERRRNPDVDPLEFVRKRLEGDTGPQQVVQQRQANDGLRRLPDEVQTPAGLAKVEQQVAEWQAYRSMGFFARQGATTVEQPRLNIAGTPTLVTPELIQRWKRLHEAAGLDGDNAATGTSQVGRGRPDARTERPAETAR